MTAPTLNGSTPIARYSAAIDITTATTDENIIGCNAGSNQEILITSLIVHNEDGANAATFNLHKHNQDGTPMNDNDGLAQAAIGADVVAGTSLAGFKVISVAAGNSQVVIDSTMNFTLKEDESLVFQASAADDLSVWISYTVFGA